MVKTTNPFDSLSDRLDQLSSRLEHLINIIDSKPATTVSSQSALLTTRKAADYLGISPKTIYNNPERFPHIKLQGGGLRFRKEDLERIISA